MHQTTTMTTTMMMMMMMMICELILEVRGCKNWWNLWNNGSSVFMWQKKVHKWWQDLQKGGKLLMTCILGG